MWHRPIQFTIMLPFSVLYKYKTKCFASYLSLQTLYIKCKKCKKLEEKCGIKCTVQECCLSLYNRTKCYASGCFLSLQNFVIKKEKQNEKCKNVAFHCTGI